ncbi:MAG: hypothetical protein LBI87_15325 [Candidatus Accumulibacter sp.]|nr:hypothetical protein [Accumulibacter sp.]
MMDNKFLSLMASPFLPKTGGAFSGMAAKRFPIPKTVPWNSYITTITTSRARKRKRHALMCRRTLRVIKDYRAIFPEKCARISLSWTTRVLARPVLKCAESPSNQAIFSKQGTIGRAKIKKFVKTP